MTRIIVIGFTILVTVLVYKFPHPMINPGELVEGHQDLNSKCVSCHEPFWGVDNKKCISCHALADIGRDSLVADSLQQNILFHASLEGQACISCHTDHKGKIPREAISNFKHTMLSLTVISNCAACHAAPGDDLHVLLDANCNKCHTTDGWESTIAFDHTFIQPDKAENCNACHAAPSDQLHKTIAESKCGTCHTNSAWKPSTFDHSTYFILDRHHNVECGTCHTNNDFTKYTCYGCHEHTSSKMISEHREEGILNVTDCASCHKSANEDDAKRVMKNQKNLDPASSDKVKDFIDPGKKHKEKNKGKDDDD